MKQEDLDKMTDEEKRVRIGELCGIPECYICPNHSEVPKERIGPQMHCPWCSDYCELQTPDYLNSLDAMHQASGHLRYVLGDQFTWLNYLNTLFEVVWGRQPKLDYIGGGLSWEVIEATARQRADAFLLTL